MMYSNIHAVQRLSPMMTLNATPSALEMQTTGAAPEIGSLTTPSQQVPYNGTSLQVPQQDLIPFSLVV